MTDVKGMYRTGLHAQIEVLEAARERLAADPEAMRESVRRTAAALSSSAPTYGFDALAESARRLSAADDEALASRLDEFLGALQEATREPDDEVVHPPRILVIAEGAAIEAAVRLANPRADVVCATNTAEVKKAFELESISALVLDLVLPEQDGRRLLSQLRRDPVAADVPAVILVPVDSPRLRMECESLGAQAVLPYPPDRDALAEALAPREEQEEPPPRILAGAAVLQELFQKIRSRVSLAEHPLCVAVLEIDQLDEMAERHGREAAARLREQVAVRIKAALRKSDLLARWTTGAMTALLLETSLDGARKALENAHESVAAAPALGPDGPVAVTLSVGLAQVVEVEILEHAVAEADRYLLRARNQGGNRILGRASEEGAEPRSVGLVEDDELLAFLAKQRLARAGFQVHHVRTAAEAREVESPELWVVDGVLPDAGPEELLPELRERSPDAPLLAVVPAGDRETVQRVYAAGADDYLVRPFDPLELQVRVQALLQHPRMPAFD